MARESNSNTQTKGNPAQAAANVTTAIAGGTGPTTAPTPEKVVQVNKDPKTLVQSFYEYYLDGFPKIDDERVIFARHLTSRFFDEALKADDYDPFLDAQDFDATWKKHFSVSEAKVTANKAQVKVSLRGKTFQWVLEVTTVKKGGVWQIDKVKNLH
ncbi:MAG: DUF3828 domain-containing protein [Acidobacteriota bacterium]